MFLTHLQWQCLILLNYNTLFNRRASIENGEQLPNICYKSSEYASSGEEWLLCTACKGKYGSENSTNAFNFMWLAIRFLLLILILLTYKRNWGYVQKLITYFFISLPFTDNSLKNGWLKFMGIVFYNTYPLHFINE